MGIKFSTTQNAEQRLRDPPLPLLSNVSKTLGMKGPAFLDPLDVSLGRQDPEFSNFLQHCCPGSVSSIPTEGEGKWAWLGERQGGDGAGI